MFKVAPNVAEPLFRDVAATAQQSHSLRRPVPIFQSMWTHFSGASAILIACVTLRPSGLPSCASFATISASACVNGDGYHFVPVTERGYSEAGVQRTTVQPHPPPTDANHQGNSATR